MDHFNAGQRGMAAAMVYPEVKLEPRNTE